MRLLITFVRGLVLGASLHFLTTFLVGNMYRASVITDTHAGMLEYSDATRRYEPLLNLLYLPFGKREKVGFSDALIQPREATLCANSAFWGLLVGLLYLLFFKGPMAQDYRHPGTRALRSRHPKLGIQVFWLSLLHFLATYTLHLFEITELLGKQENSPVIDIARAFRFPLTPMLFSDTLWQSQDILISDRFWLILPNSLIWGFAMTLLIRGATRVGKKGEGARG